MQSEQGSPTSATFCSTKGVRVSQRCENDVHQRTRADANSSRTASTSSSRSHSLLGPYGHTDDMRIPLTPSPAFLAQLADPASTPSPSDPPLIWIDSQPFLLELQGILEPPADEKGAAEAGDAVGASMEGVRVGKVDLADPVSRGVLSLAFAWTLRSQRMLAEYDVLLTDDVSPARRRNQSSESHTTASKAKLRNCSRPTPSSAPLARPPLLLPTTTTTPTLAQQSGANSPPLLPLPPIPSPPPAATNHKSPSPL